MVAFNKGQGSHKRVIEIRVDYVALFRISQQIIEYMEDLNQNGFMNPIVYMFVSLRGKGKKGAKGETKVAKRARGNHSIYIRSGQIIVNQAKVGGCSYTRLRGSEHGF